MATRKDNAARKRSPSVELSEILGRLADARSVIETACRAMEAEDCADEIVTLRHGLRMLDRVYNELDLVT